MTRRAELKQRARGSLRGNYVVVVGVFLLTSMILSVCSGIIRLISGVVGTFFTAGSIAFGGTAGLGRQLNAAVVTGSIPSIVFSLLTSILYSGLTYILLAGEIKVYLKMCAGEKAEIGDLFWGFRNDPMRFAGIGALIMAVLELCLLPVVILAVAMAVSGEGGFVLFVVLFMLIYGLILTVVGIYLALTFGMFLYVLVDRPGMTVWEAFGTSRKLMKGNRIRLVALQLSFIGWGLIAMLTLGVGMLWINGYILCTTTWFYKDLYPQVETIPPTREYGDAGYDIPDPAYTDTEKAE